MQHECMAQGHTSQEGLFLVTTNAKGRVPWLTVEGVPEILIHDLCYARTFHGAHLYAFCILPNHMHIILGTGMSSLSTFMHSFKMNSSRNIRRLFSSDGYVTVAINTSNIDPTLKDHAHAFVAMNKSNTNNIHIYPALKDLTQAFVAIHTSNPNAGTPSKHRREYPNTPFQWQHSFHARLLQGNRAIDGALSYVQRNAVHHGLVQDAHDWPWSSLAYTHELDGLERW